jgi:SAM-dependent methyltransferase
MEIAKPHLDLGCGRRPQPGSIGLDVVPLAGVDVVARLESLPIRAASLGRAYALNVLEHLDDLAGVLWQIHAALAPGGVCVVEVPYFTSVSAFADPTHRRWFTYTTFEHFCRPAAQGWQANRHTWFGGPRFYLAYRRLRFGRAHRCLGVEWLANRYPAVYENLFAHWFPARALEAELVKEVDLTPQPGPAPPRTPLPCSD